MRFRRHHQSGFTLIELLIAISILGIIMYPLAAAVVIGYRTMDSTANSLSGSSDAQFLSIYLPADLKSADSGTTSGITCTGVTITNAKLQLASAVAANVTSGPLASAASVVYWLKAVTGGFQLVRSVCGSSPQSTVVARNIVLVASVVVTTVTVSSVTKGYSMAVTEKKLGSESGAYVFTVSGRFRTGLLT